MTRRVVPFLAAITWLGLAGPSRALESPKPLYVQTLERIPASSLEAVRARPGTVALPGVKPCAVTMEAWSGEKGGTTIVLDVSFGYANVDFAAASATHAAGEELFAKVFRQGLSSVAAPGAERWGGSKVRLLMRRPVADPSAAAGGEAGRATTVVLLRHAEKTSKNRYAELSRAGRRRAEALVEELRTLLPEALYASSLKRTQQTLAPLAAAMRLEVKVRPFGDEDAVASEILAEHAGRVVVVCGHSDTLAGLADALGWSGEFPRIDSFDRIWMVTVPASGAPISLIETRQRFGRR